MRRFSSCSQYGVQPKVHVGNHITKQYHNHKLASVWQGYITGSKESQNRIKEQQTDQHKQGTYYQVQRYSITKQILRYLIVFLPQFYANTS